MGEHDLSTCVCVQWEEDGREDRLKPQGQGGEEPKTMTKQLEARFSPVPFPGRKQARTPKQKARTVLTVLCA